MSGKKVGLSARPKPMPTAPPTAEAWVEKRTEEETKRLTVEIPASLHARIKGRCGLEGYKMTDRILEILEREFPA